MARRKSGGDSVLAIIVLATLGGLASVPKEVWVVVLVTAAVLGVIYLLRRSFSSEGRPPETQPAPLTKEKPRQTSASEPNTTQPELSTGFRIPKAPTLYERAQWVGPGQTVAVAGRTIPGGMVYVGTSLPTQWGVPDPCLIDPSKPVARQGDFTQSEMDYWPSYSDVSRQARAAYLDWLADGRRQPEAQVGYVFLFFYGLERRVIRDVESNPEARNDLPAIAQELRELLSVYGPRSGSFRRYASELLNWVETVDFPPRMFERPVPQLPRTFELPLYLRLALGQAAAAGAPVPAHLALAWACVAPEISLRTPATRCTEEFRRLFVEKYEQAFGSGMVLPKNRTRLKYVYRPASAGFREYKELSLNFNDIPDVAVLTGPIRKLAAVVEEATVPLEAFSRHARRNPTDRTSLEALLLLPAAIWPEEGRRALERLKERVGEGMIVLRTCEPIDFGAANARRTS